MTLLLGPQKLFQTFPHEGPFNGLSSTVVQDMKTILRSPFTVISQCTCSVSTADILPGNIMWLITPNGSMQVVILFKRTLQWC